MATTVLFVGTDTDVGKTHAVSIVAAHAVSIGHRVGVYKPVASGCDDTDRGRVASDANAIWAAAGRPGSIDDVCPQKFLAAIAPDQAARAEGLRVDEDMMKSGLRKWQDEYPIVLVEGAGGLFSPISDRCLNIDLVSEFSIDHVVLVAANRIGVIHQVISCIEAAAHRGVTISGIILSTIDDRDDPSRVSNRAGLQARIPTPVLAELPWVPTSSSVPASWPTDGLPIPGIPPRAS